MDEEEFFSEDIITLNMATVKAKQSKKVLFDIPIVPEEPVEKYPKWAAYHKFTRKKIEWLKETLEGIFPGNWDLQEKPVLGLTDSVKHNLEMGLSQVDEEKEEFKIATYNRQFTSTNEYFTVYIRIPEVVVKNGTRLTHLMKECYFRFTFTYGLNLIKPTFLRAVKTYNEYTHSYNFSHAQRSQSASWVGLCFGETPLDMDISLLYVDWNDVKLETVLYQLIDYLSWESKSGGPYVKIEDLFIKSETRAFSVPPPKMIDQLYKDIIKAGIPQMPLVHKKLGRIINFEVQANDFEFWKYITGFSADSWKFPYDENRGETFNTETNDSRTREEINRINRNSESIHIFTFKGNHITFKIDDEAIFSTDKIRLIHESIRNIIIKKINTNFNKHFIDEFRSKH